MRRVVHRDATYVALLAAASLVAVQSYSFSSLFGGSGLGLRAKNSGFCKGPTCLKAAPAAPSLRAKGKDGEFVL